jgi:hypothetical protein
VSQTCGNRNPGVRDRDSDPAAGDEVVDEVIGSMAKVSGEEYRTPRSCLGKNNSRVSCRDEEVRVFRVLG